MVEEKKSVSTKDVADKNTKKDSDKKVEFKGKYTKAIGRRKTAVAQVRMYEKGDDQIVVNNMSTTDYFDETGANVVAQPIKLTGIKGVGFSILVKGGGKSAQSEAARHGISRLLLATDEEYKLPLKAKGWLTRDSRRAERKKPGLKKARKAPQWSKR